jgi:hypothetical protein
MIADAVERQHGRRVAYAVTADPVHKPSLRAVDLLDRVASIRLGGGGTRMIVLTERDPLFIDKARQFPGAGIALGVDALVRMLDPSWGPNVAEMLETFRALGTRFYDRQALQMGQPMPGPAIVFHPDTTTLVPPGWTACAHESGNLTLGRMAS